MWQPLTTVQSVTHAETWDSPLFLTSFWHSYLITHYHFETCCFCIILCALCIRPPTSFCDMLKSSISFVLFYDHVNIFSKDVIEEFFLQYVSNMQVSASCLKLFVVLSHVTWKIKFKIIISYQWSLFKFGPEYVGLHHCLSLSHIIIFTQ